MGLIGMRNHRHTCLAFKLPNQLLGRPTPIEIMSVGVGTCPSMFSGDNHMGDPIIAT